MRLVVRFIRRGRFGVGEGRGGKGKSVGVGCLECVRGLGMGLGLRFAWAWGFERCRTVDLGGVILKKKERKKGRKNGSATCK